MPVNFSVTVRAKTAAWNTSSDTYTFHPSKICKYHEDWIYFSMISLCFNIVPFWIFMCPHNHIPSVQITRPKLKVTTTSDRILVTWTIASHKMTTNCQVKYRKVLYASLWSPQCSIWSIFWKQQWNCGNCIDPSLHSRGGCNYAVNTFLPVSVCNYTLNNKTGEQFEKKLDFYAD